MPASFAAAVRGPGGGTSVSRTHGVSPGYFSRFSCTQEKTASLYALSSPNAAGAKTNSANNAIMQILMDFSFL